MIFTAAVIGTGNLAHHMVPAMENNPFVNVKYIVSRNYINAKEFADGIKATALHQISDIPDDVNLIFIWTNDDQIANISENLSQFLDSKTFIVHSSGTKTLDSINGFFENKAVMWPIQSLSKSDINIKLVDVPICIMASNESSQKIILKICNEISCCVKIVSEAQKSILHLCAVLSNNFTNHLFHLSKLLLEENDLNFDLLLPIICQTIEKIKVNSPELNQTGPALRNDKKTMESHLELINNKELKQIYKSISESIFKLNKL